MIKFKVVPKVFTTPSDSTGYIIDAIGVSIVGADISAEAKMKLQFSFISNGAINQTATKEVAKKVTIPNLGDIDLLSGLLSYDNTKVYSVATLFAMQAGFQLLPFDEQTDLLTL